MPVCWVWLHATDRHTRLGGTGEGFAKQCVRSGFYTLSQLRIRSKLTVAWPPPFPAEPHKRSQLWNCRRKNSPLVWYLWVNICRKYIEWFGWFSLFHGHCIATETRSLVPLILKSAIGRDSEILDFGSQFHKSPLLSLPPAQFEILFPCCYKSVFHTLPLQIYIAYEIILLSFDLLVHLITVT